MSRREVAYDAFVKEWFEDRAMPEYLVTGAKKEKRAQGYDVTLTVNGDVNAEGLRLSAGHLPTQLGTFNVGKRDKNVIALLRKFAENARAIQCGLYAAVFIEPLLVPCRIDSL